MFVPNTTIRFMKGVPLDSTYRNTLWFDTVEEQTEHFINSYEYKFYTNQTYQRVGKGKLRVKEFPEHMYSYNYLAFRNNYTRSDIPTEKGKIFYCFITGVEYINENTTEVSYVIDYMQTWFFDYDLGMCFVEREHSETDEIGENLVPENLELGDYNISAPLYIDGDENDVGLDDMAICVASTAKVVNDNVVDSEGAIYNGIFSGVELITFQNNEVGVTAFNNFISKLTASAKSDAIVSVFMIPLALVNTGSTNVRHDYSYTKDYTSIKHTNPNETIRNNKLYTSPYNFLYVTNMQGNCGEYPFEYFDTSDTECDFLWYGDFSPNPSVVLAPFGYKGSGLENFDEKMVLSGYPQLAFNIDTYRAWLAQNKGTLAVEALSTVSNTVKGVASTAIQSVINPVGAVATGLSTGANLLNDIAGTVGTVYQKSLMPNQAKGGGSPLLMASFGKLNYMFATKHIRPEFVDIIDGYFDMFGYATHKVKYPNRNSRPRWNYIKTKGCILLGTTGCPSEAVKAICSIYDNGITFWKPTSIVGDYSQDNSVGSD